MAECDCLRAKRLPHDKTVDVVCGQKDEKALPETFVNYEEKPREYTLCGISAAKRCSDIVAWPDRVGDVLEISRAIAQVFDSCIDQRLRSKGFYHVVSYLPRELRGISFQSLAKTANSIG